MSSTEQSQRLMAEDLLRFETVSDPQVSPDGRRVAWVRTWIEASHNGYRSAICVTDLETGAESRLAEGESVSHPRWSPDGHLLSYLDQGQLWLVSSAGGQPRPLTSLASRLQQPVWSPDGRFLACLTRVDPARGLDGANGSEEQDPYRKFTSDVLVVTRSHWKLNGPGFFGATRSHLVLVPVEPGQASALLTCGEYDVGPPSWAPDGQSIAVVGNTDPDADDVRRAALLLVPVNDRRPAEPRPLFWLEEMRSANLAWSPDGSTIAVTGHDDPTLGHYGNQYLWTVSVATGEGRNLTQALDRTLGNAAGGDLRGYGGDSGVRWTPDGTALLALLSDRGQVHLVKADAATGKVTPLTEGDIEVSCFSVDASGRTAVALIHGPDGPGDLWALDLSQEQPNRRRVTAVNDRLLAERKLSKPERFPVPTGAGEKADAWVLPPAELERGRRYPAILYCGGGPGGMRGSAFWFEYQLLAANGYAVIYANTRGCQGYGESFCTAILGSWGGVDYEDNLLAVQLALEQFDFIDAGRLGVAGGSYGGYSTNWIIGHTNLFKAAVTDRCVSNRYSSWGTSDIGHLREFEFGGGPPWESTDHYLRQSPLLYLKDCRTPTLVIHADQDYRCPIEQGEQVYLALKRLGVPTEFVRFSGENHDLSRNGRPWHRVFRHKQYIAWFDRWLGGDV